MEDAKYQEVHPFLQCDVGRRYPATSPPPTLVCAPTSSHLTGQADDVQQHGVLRRGPQHEAIRAGCFELKVQQQPWPQRSADAERPPRLSAHVYCNNRQTSHSGSQESAARSDDGCWSLTNAGVRSLYLPVDS
ncbi:hypothetical protein OPT61_g207 [Boeremia exigua]|uniref:Uncharacterized protein n=1 Tax=Boeremia exigua TaxID=749465 RepID=A0ACC2IUN3_9PLEO|nr:hypothetical protein OPT61_g207 [Boeremia exigua]